MFLPITVVLAAAVLAVQLVICFRSRRKLLRWMLPVTLTGGTSVCLAVMAAERFVRLPFGAAFAACIYGMIFLLFLGADALVWLIWGMVELIQKYRK